MGYSGYRKIPVNIWENCGTNPSFFPHSDPWFLRFWALETMFLSPIYVSWKSMMLTIHSVHETHIATPILNLKLGRTFRRCGGKSQLSNLGFSSFLLHCQPNITSFHLKTSKAGLREWLAWSRRTGQLLICRLRVQWGTTVWEDSPSILEEAESQLLHPKSTSWNPLGHHMGVSAKLRQDWTKDVHWKVGRRMLEFVIFCWFVMSF